MESEYRCSKCGAKYFDNDNCDDRFSLLLAREFESADYGIVHHLSVPSYHLQHNLYSKQGWIETRELLRRFVIGEITPDAARRELRDDFDGSKRGFSLTKGEKLTEVDSIRWSFTISDVRFDTAEIYCHDVKRWAQSIIDDTDSLHLLSVLKR